MQNIYIKIMHMLKYAWRDWKKKSSVCEKRKIRVLVIPQRRVTLRKSFAGSPSFSVVREDEFCNPGQWTECE